MKIKSGSRYFNIDKTSILIFIIFCFNVCYLKIAYYFELPTVWNSLYKWCEHILFMYLVILLLSYIIRKKKIYVSHIILLVSLLLIYELVVSYFNNIFSLYVIEQIAIWPMCFIVGVLYCDKLITKRFSINITIIIYGLLCIPSIISNLKGDGNIGGVIFPVYILIAMGSFLLIQKNSILKTELIIFIGVIILCTTKRAGLLCIALGLFLYYLVDVICKHKSVNGFIKIVIVIICAVLLGIGAIYYFNLDILQRFAELQSDGGSGRNGIWQQVYLGFQESNLHSKIFGHGFNAVACNLNIQGRQILAHNDYLEYLYDYGIVGVGLVICLLISILKCFYLCFKKRNSLAPAFAYVVISFAFLSTFSYLMDQSIVINFFALFLGMTFNNNRCKMQNELQK